MRCLVCRSWVGLQATTCACGFDLTTKDVSGVMERARRDLVTGLHVVVGLGAAGVLVLLAGGLGSPG